MLYKNALAEVSEDEKINVSPFVAIRW